MKEQYKWNYNIKIKTKEGTYEYEKESLDNIDLLLEKHKDYEEDSIIGEDFNIAKRILMGDDKE